MEQLSLPTLPRTIGERIARAINNMYATYTNSRKLFSFTVLLITYLATGIFSITLYPSIAPALVWPPTGIMFAGLFLEGIELWPVVTIGATFVMLMGGISPLAAFAIGCFNTLQAVLGVYLLRRFNFSPLFVGLRDIFILILDGLFVTMLAPGLSSLVLWATHTLSAPASLHIWWSWWLGQALSVIVLSSLILRWFARRPRPRTHMEIAEWTISFILLIAVSIVAYWTPLSAIGNVPIVYILLIPLIWIALSVGPRAMSLALFLMTAISISGTIFGDTQLAAGLVTADRIIQVELLNLILSIIFFIFVSSEEGRKIATRDLRHHVEQLENALYKISSEDRAKNEFLAILAHELRNPLAPIVSSIELLRLGSVSPSEEQELLETMNDRVRTMGRLLDDLLDISRISQKKFKLQKETVDLSSIIKRSANSTSVIMRERGHTLLVSLPQDPMWMQGDPVRLEQIVINLLNNAAKYTEHGGTIELFTTRDDERVSIHVRDSGIGISKEMLTRVFEPFRQVEGGRRSEGLGIGLSLAKRLVEMHDGSIEATSAGLGRGSEFIVRLPLPGSVQLPMPITSKLLRHMPKATRSLRVLVVDDNRPAADGLSRLLAHKGHEVSVAYDGAGGLQATLGNKPDVVLLDIGLPDMEGYEVARLLRERGCRCYLIALTGFGQEEDKLKAQQAGFDHHLTKPVGIADVEQVLAKVEPRLESAAA